MVAEERRLPARAGPRERRPPAHLHRLVQHHPPARARRAPLHRRSPQRPVQGLKQTFLLFRDERHAAMLGLTALDGELFGGSRLPRPGGAPPAATRTLLRALFHLSTFEDTPEGRGRAAGAASAAGSTTPAWTSRSWARSTRACSSYHPQVDPEQRPFDLVAGSERKQTGSYYTPHGAGHGADQVRAGAGDGGAAGRGDDAGGRRSARCSTSGSVDPAAGSGTSCSPPRAGSGKRAGARAHRRARAARPRPTARAVRDVVRHCLYAVDRNPLAVDLCKVALWIEGHDARPCRSPSSTTTSSCGDSLIGVFDLKVLEEGIPDEAYKPLTGDDKDVAQRAEDSATRRSAKGQQTLGLFGCRGLVAAGRSARAALELEAFEDEARAAVPRRRDATQQFRELTPTSGGCARPATSGPPRSSPSSRSRSRASPSASRPPITCSGRCATSRHPGGDEDRARAGAGRTASSTGRSSSPRSSQGRLRRGARQPAVGADQAPGAGVLRQPRPEIARRRAGPSAKRLIKRARGSQTSALASSTSRRKRAVSRRATAVRPCLAGASRSPPIGDVNTYALFAETFLDLSSEGPGARASSSRPASRPTTAPKRSSMSCTSERRLVSLARISRTGRSSFRACTAAPFCLLTLGATSRRPRFAFLRHSDRTPRRRAAAVHASPEDIALINPNTEDLPGVPQPGRRRADQKDLPPRAGADRREPGRGRQSLGHACSARACSTWPTTAACSGRMPQLREPAGSSTASVWTLPNGERWLPLYEAKMIHHFDHRWATYGADR